MTADRLYTLAEARSEIGRQRGSVRTVRKAASSRANLERANLAPHEDGCRCVKCVQARARAVLAAGGCDCAACADKEIGGAE